MQSHPPLTSMYEVTRQRSAFTGLLPEPTAEALVVMASPRPQQVGRRYDLPRGDAVLFVGRDPQTEVPVQSDAVSRRHCKLTRDAQGWTVEDLRSTNGTFVNDAPVTRAALRAGDQLRVGDTVLKLLGGDLEGALIDRMLREALRDTLTQAYTRSHFDAEAESCLHEVRASQRRATLLVLDLDRFKQINDRWGHVTGDAVMRETAHRVTAVLPDDAVFARLGGEEFAVLLPSFGAASARLVAERVRVAVAASPISCGDAVVDVTCSMGIAEATRATGDVEAWMRAADELLYAAKRNGRNRVEG
ncbi:MAG: GGDEF domain-containing protein [Polyangiales bacterium]